MELYKVAHGIGNNQNFKPSSKRELSKSQYIIECHQN